MPVTDWHYATTISGTGWAFDLTSLLVSVGYNGGSYNDGNLVRHSGSVSAAERLLLTDWQTSAAVTLADSLPASCIPEGLELECEGYFVGPDLLAFPELAYLGFYLSKDAIANYGAERQFSVQIAPGPSAVETLGGATDLWGGGWSDVEMGSMSLFMGSGSSSTHAGSCGRAADYVRIRVYYSEVVTPPPAVFAALGDMDHVPPYAVQRPDLEVRTG